MDVGAVEPRGVVVPRRLVGGRLEPDQRAEALRRAQRELEHDLAPDRAAEDDRAIERERVRRTPGSARRRPRSSAGTPRPASPPAAGTCRGAACRRRGPASAGVTAGSVMRCRNWRPSAPAVWRQTRGQPWPASSKYTRCGCPPSVEAEVASDDRLELGHRDQPGRQRAPRRGEHVLHVAEVCHQRPEVALDPGHAELLHREEVVIARLGEGLPEARPRFGGRADGEAPRAQEEGPAFDRGQAPARPRGPDTPASSTASEERRGESLASPDEPGVGVDEIRKTGEDPVGLGRVHGGMIA